LTSGMALGGLDERPEDRTSMVAEGAFLGTNLFVILDSQVHQVRVYSASREHLHSFGRRGEGPGEFDRLPMLLATGDGTIRIWDGPQHGTTFDGEGRYLSSKRSMGRTDTRYVQLAGALSDNRVIWKQPSKSRGAEDAPGGVCRDTTFHELSNPDGISSGPPSLAAKSTDGGRRALRPGGSDWRPVGLSSLPRRAPNSGLSTRHPREKPVLICRAGARCHPMGRQWGEFAPATEWPAIDAATATLLPTQ
jgi:hypothetical protein